MLDGWTISNTVQHVTFAAKKNFALSGPMSVFLQIFCLGLMGGGNKTQKRIQ